VLYLAEVQKKGRVIGSGRAELRLLAFQRSEQSWSAVSGEEVIPAPDDANYNAGALVMVELTSSKQVQRHSEAGRQLVSILQNFSRLQEKAKAQEDEIEQWKQSLTYQSQELNRREMDMETRQEQLQQLEEDLAQLDQQRQDVEVARDELTRLREEFERKSQELEGAWAHLRGEMNRFEERQSEFQQMSVLDDQQAHVIQDLLNRLSGAVTPTETVREQLNLSFDQIAQQQGTLEQHYQEMEQQRASAQQLQDEVDQQSQDIQNRWHEWHQTQDGLEQTKAELKAQQTALRLKQELEKFWSDQIDLQDILHQQVLHLAEGTDGLVIGAKVDVSALETMPLEELKSSTQDMERDLEKLSRFVNGQEEELTVQQQMIEDLQRQIQQASEYDRLRLENELTDEQESYRMLNETLVGQRRTLQERQTILKKRQAILARRTGTASPDVQQPEIDVTPLLSQLVSTRDKYSQELADLRGQIQQIQTALDQLQNTVNQKVTEQESRRNELKQIEQHWSSQRAAAAELWGKVNTYEALLQPIQDGVHGVRSKLEAITHVMAQFQEASDYQLQAIAEMRQVIASLTNQTPEYAAS